MPFQGKLEKFFSCSKKPFSKEGVGNHFVIDESRYTSTLFYEDEKAIYAYEGITVTEPTMIFLPGSPGSTLKSGSSSPAVQVNGSTSPTAASSRNRHECFLLITNFFIYLIDNSILEKKIYEDDLLFIPAKGLPDNRNFSEGSTDSSAQSFNSDMGNNLSSNDRLKPCIFLRHAIVKIDKLTYDPYMQYLRVRIFFEEHKTSETGSILRKTYLGNKNNKISGDAFIRDGHKLYYTIVPPSEISPELIHICKRVTQAHFRHAHIIFSFFLNIYIILF